MWWGTSRRNRGTRPSEGHPRCQCLFSSDATSTPGELTQMGTSKDHQGCGDTSRLWAFTSGDLPMACIQGTRQPTQTSRSSSDWTRPGSRRTRVWKVGGGVSSQWPGLPGYSAAVNDELNRAQESQTNEDGAIPAQSSSPDTSQGPNDGR